MAENRAVLVGGMAAASKAFERVKAQLEIEGWQVSAFLGGGKSIAAPLDEILTVVEKASAVLIGMSFPTELAKEELAAGQRALELGKPLALYADSFGACYRQHFAKLRGANLVFVINENEKQNAEGLFKNAQVVVSGNHEWEDASFPKFSRDEMRAKLGVADDEKLILVAGHKSVSITAFLLMSVVHAVNQSILSNRKLKVVLAPHPGDGVSPKAYAEPVLYTNVPVRIVTKEKIYARREVSGKEPELEEREGGFLSSDLLPAADLLAESASTFCQAAAILRIPVVSVLSEVSKKRNVEVFGHRNWEPVIQGVAKEVSGDPSEATLIISEILSNQAVLKSIQLHQRMLYPGFKEKGEFAKRIANVLNAVAVSIEK